MFKINFYKKFLNTLRIKWYLLNMWPIQHLVVRKAYHSQVQGGKLYSKWTKSISYETLRITLPNLNNLYVLCAYLISLTSTHLINCLCFSSLVTRSTRMDKLCRVFAQPYTFRCTIPENLLLKKNTLSMQFIDCIVNDYFYHVLSPLSLNTERGA